ncbi:MAG: hypothetical protein ACPGFB_03205 [Verrucomicrobiales bacterium]
MLDRTGASFYDALMNCRILLGVAILTEVIGITLWKLFEGLPRLVSGKLSPLFTSESAQSRSPLL